MKLLALDLDQFSYLLHAFTQHTQAGIAPSELAIAAHTFAGLQSAREIKDEQQQINLGHAELTKLGPDGVELNITG